MEKTKREDIVMPTEHDRLLLVLEIADQNEPDTSVLRNEGSWCGGWEYNWREAFEYADFAIEDVQHVLRAREGIHDEADWLIVVRLQDGRYGYLEAGCDYTGWDCQAGGASVADSDLGKLVRLGIGADKCRALLRDGVS